MSIAAPVSTATGPVNVGTWTILCEGDETVRATITRERESFIVRDATGTLLGRCPTLQLALKRIV